MKNREEKNVRRGVKIMAGPTGGLTTRKYVSIARTSRATAFREIAGMLDKKVLRQLSGKGRSVHYDLVWPKE
ncbi:MAG: hypothetical protein WC628_07765 [Candidatus Omnitrophota bacterium]